MTGPSFIEPTEAQRAAMLAGVEQAPPPPETARKSRPTSRAARRARSEEVARERAARAAATPDTPPAPKLPRKTAPRAGTTKAHVAKSIEGLHGAAAVVLAMSGKPVTSQVLESSAADAGKVWAELSDRYPIIAKWLTGGGDAMLFVNLAMIYGPIVMTAASEPRDPNASADLAGLLAKLAGAGGVPAEAAAA